MERGVIQKNSSRKSSLEFWLKTTQKAYRIKCQITKQLSAAVSKEKVEGLTQRDEVQSSLTRVGDCKLLRALGRDIKMDVL